MKRTKKTLIGGNVSLYCTFIYKRSIIYEFLNKKYVVVLILLRISNTNVDAPGTLIHDKMVFGNINYSNFQQKKLLFMR